MDGAGTALAEAAAEARTMQSKLIPENIEERRIGVVHGDRNREAVHAQLNLLRHAATRRAGGAMNSGPTGSLIVSRMIRSISPLARASSLQPITSSTGRSWSG